MVLEKRGKIKHRKRAVDVSHRQRLSKDFESGKGDFS